MSNINAQISKLTKEQLAELKETFALFDRNGDGKISSDELFIVMRKLGLNPTNKEIKEIIREVDIDGNGKIDFKEFIIMSNKMYNSFNNLSSENLVSNPFNIYNKSSPNKITPATNNTTITPTNAINNGASEELRASFRYFDKDGDGYISSVELRHVMGKVGQKLTDKEIDEIIQQVDLDGDGRISFDEFLEMMDSR